MELMRLGNEQKAKEDITEQRLDSGLVYVDNDWDGLHFWIFLSARLNDSPQNVGNTHFDGEHVRYCS